MRKFLVLTAVVAFMFGAAALPAHAVPVTFSTEISYNGGAYSANNTLALPGDGGTMYLTFYGVNTTANDGDTVSLGTFVTSGFSWFSGVSATFNIMITQVSPPGADGVGGDLTGGISYNGSFAQAAFSDDSATIGGITYQVLNSPVPLVDPSNGGTSVVSANLSSSPEPSTLLLVGTGLTGLAGVVRRRIGRRQ